MADRKTTTPTLAQPLNEQIAVQTGAVVSRMLLKKKSGNVTLFAFDEGEGLSEHKAPFDALVYTVQGSARITVGGETSTLAEGDFVIFPADVPHAVTAQVPFKMLLIMLRA